MNDKYPLLGEIKGPEHLKLLEDKELDRLCEEIRQKLIETVSVTGGHLASNLGTVELTVALHRSFNSPQDKIIWDVSHQAYTHKLLTGRFDSFDTLRTENGISGFTRPDESEHDASYEGHAGTSVSRAAGIAAANALKGSKNYSIAVIGDGSFSNGMVYEALNHAGAMNGRLIVILNDNEMSISENVGAMARYLAVVRSKPEYYRFKARTEKALNKIPLIGHGLSYFFFHLKTLIKSFIYKSSFFEDLGFRYIGPIDGHDVSKLCEAMNSAKMVDRPVLIHINTVKGKGYDFAEKSPSVYHGVSEFDVSTGKSEHKSKSFSSAFGDAMLEFAAKDKRICVVSAAMSLGTGLADFFKTYPERSFDVGIAEEHGLTFCSGLAIDGMLPVFAVYSTFLQRCADQLIHDGALQRKKMVVCVDRAGFVGEDGETHQGVFDVSILQSLPNTTVYSPATYKGIRHSLYNAFYQDEGLVVVRYPRGSMPEYGSMICTDDDCELFGDEKAETAIVTYGRVFFEAYEALSALSQKGYNVKLVKLNRIKPVPEEAYYYVSNCKNVLFFEEGMKGGGTGECFGCSLSEKGVKADYLHIAVEDEFVPHASIRSLLKRYKLDSASITEITEKEVTK